MKADPTLTSLSTDVVELSEEIIDGLAAETPNSNTQPASSNTTEQDLYALDSSNEFLARTPPLFALLRLTPEPTLSPMNPPASNSTVSSAKEYEDRSDDCEMDYVLSMEFLDEWARWEDASKAAKDGPTFGAVPKEPVKMVKVFKRPSLRATAELGDEPNFASRATVGSLYADAVAEGDLEAELEVDSVD